MRKELIFMLLLLVMCAANAQEETKGKKHIRADRFERTSSVTEDVAKAMRGAVIDGFAASQRVEISDVESESSLQVEEARREQDNIEAGENVDRLKTMSIEAADFLLHGTVVSYSVGSNSDNTGFVASGVVNLQLLDPATGHAVRTHQITAKSGQDSKDGSLLGGLLDLLASDNCASKQEAFKRVLLSIKSQSAALAKAGFPVQGQILDIATIKKDEAKEVYISVGSDAGASPGNKFLVYMQKNVAGRDVEERLGELELKEVSGVDISKCVVKKGGKAILRANDAKQTLYVRSI